MVSTPADTRQNSQRNETEEVVQDAKQFVPIAVQRCFVVAVDDDLAIAEREYERDAVTHAVQ